MRQLSSSGLRFRDLGQTAAELQAEYCRIGLGGKPQEAVDDVSGVSPSQGSPTDAPPGQAAVGGAAASIAPLAAAVAAGGSEETAAKVYFSAIGIDASMTSSA